jgi:hypothetical protein
MTKNSDVFQPLAVSLGVVAVLATLCVEDGWGIGLPIVLALAFVVRLRHACSG